MTPDLTSAQSTTPKFFSIVARIWLEHITLQDSKYAHSDGSYITGPTLVNYHSLSVSLYYGWDGAGKQSVLYNPSQVPAWLWDSLWEADNKVLLPITTYISCDDILIVVLRRHNKYGACNCVWVHACTYNTQNSLRVTRNTHLTFGWFALYATS